MKGHNKRSTKKDIAAKNRRGLVALHWPHDFGADGRCRVENCDVYDVTEDEPIERDEY
jgi:hypothetical protein